MRDACVMWERLYASFPYFSFLYNHTQDDQQLRTRECP